MVLNHALQFRFRGRPIFVDLFEERKDGEKGRHGDRIESVREEECVVGGLHNDNINKISSKNYLFLKVVNINNVTHDFIIFVKHFVCISIRLFMCFS